MKANDAMTEMRDMDGETKAVSRAARRLGHAVVRGLGGATLALGMLTSPASANTIGSIQAVTPAVDTDFPRTPITQAMLPLTIFKAGSYYLAENLVATADTSFLIRVTTADVTIDLNGFRIVGSTGSLGASSCILLSNAHNASISNGTIRGCKSVGISGYSSDFVQIDRVRLLNNGSLGADLGHGALVSRSTTANNGGQGLRVAEGSVVEAVVAYGNDSHGIQGNDGSVFQSVAAMNNSLSGVLGGVGAVVRGVAAMANLTGVEVGLASAVTSTATTQNASVGIKGDKHMLLGMCTAVGNGYGFWTGQSALTNGVTADNDNEEIWGTSNVTTGTYIHFK
jgi:hypothetical protein